MKVKKVKYYNLIFMCLILFATLITIFKITPAQVVNADSVENITQENSICLTYSSKDDKDFNGIADLHFDTFIFKFDKPILAGSHMFRANVKCNLLNGDNKQFRVGMMSVGKIVYFNKDNIVDLTLNTNAFEYAQIIVPVSFQEEYEEARLEYFNLSVVDNDFIANANLLYISKAVNPYSYYYNIATNFNVPIYNSVNDFLVEPIKTYSIIFKGLTSENNYYDLINYNYQIDNYDNFISDLTIEEMYANAKNLCNSFTKNNKWYDFANWDINISQTDNLKQNWIVKPVYMERTSTIYQINFYGGKGELLKNYSYYKYSNGTDYINTETIKNMFDIMNEIALSKNNSGGFNSETCEYGFYYNKYFKNWSVKYSDDLIITSDLNIYGVWEQEDKIIDINVYGQDKKFIKTIKVQNGTLFKELNLIAEKIYLYDFKNWIILDNFAGALYDYSMLIKNIDIMPLYETISVKFEIKPLLFKDGYFDDEKYNSFDYTTIYSNLVELGETIELPQIKHITSFKPMFYTEYDGIVISGNIEEIYNNRLSDLDLKNITIPNDYDRHLIKTIYIVYRFDNSTIDTPIDNNENVDANKTSFNWNYVFIPFLIIVCVIIIYLIFRIIKEKLV